MSVSLQRVFAPTPCQPAKVRSAIDALSRGLSDGSKIDLVIATVTLPSGLKKQLNGQSLDLLSQLPDGSSHSLEVDWKSPAGTVLRIHWSWLDALGLMCDFEAQDEIAIARAVEVVVEHLGVTPLRNGLDAPGQHIADPLVAALHSHDVVLSDRYVQACRDIADRGRLSYHAPMHDLRDILAAVLRDLAPDEDVRRQRWYKQEPDTDRPSQAQRARYILESLRERGSSAVKVASEAIETLSALTRSAYGRASVAHVKASREEATQIMRYVDALLSDLLGVRGR
jgi:hypothetical protein